jgi:hypothetical protein
MLICEILCVYRLFAELNSGTSFQKIAIMDLLTETRY